MRAHGMHIQLAFVHHHAMVWSIILRTPPDGCSLVLTLRVQSFNPTSRCSLRRCFSVHQIAFNWNPHYVIISHSITRCPRSQLFSVLGSDTSGCVAAKKVLCFADHLPTMLRPLTIDCWPGVLHTNNIDQFSV